MGRDRGKIKIGIAVAVIVILLLVLGFLVLDNIVPNKVSENVPSPKDAEKSMKEVQLPSGTYYKRDGIDNYLIIGLDSKGQMTSSESYYNNDQADFLILVSVDNNQQTCRFLQINRDTMAYVNKLSITGQRYDTAAQQIALAHTYGDGMSTSCFNTVDAVSNLLYGVDIDYYVAITMDAVIRLTDYVGGVNITMDKDYTEINPKYLEGASLKLDGENALEFVRERTALKDSTNIARQERQNLFIHAFINQMKGEYLGSDFVSGAFSCVDNYMLTNAKENKIYDLIQNLKSYKFADLKTPNGTANYINTYAEFYVDPDDLERIVVEMFYEN